MKHRPGLAWPASRKERVMQTHRKLLPLIVVTLAIKVKITIKRR